jgi:hypothetical protein
METVGTVCTQMDTEGRIERVAGRAGLRLPDWIATGTVSGETKELAKLLLGAATAFAAVVFTDDLDKAEGSLWPGTKTKDAYETAFKSKHWVGGTAEYQAAFEDRVAPGNSPDRQSITGWGFTARYRRARILERRLHRS